MKKFHIILPVFVVAILLMLTPVVNAEAAEGKPGQTVTVTFSFNEIRGLDGTFSFSDEGIFSEVSYSSSFQGMRFNNGKVFYSTTVEEATAGTITVTAKIKEDAAVGSNCTITLGDINITDANTNSIYSGSKSEVVTVVEEPVVTKAPVKPTATPASQSGNQNGNQNNNQNQVQKVTEKPDDGQGQNVVDNSSSDQSQNKTPTEAPGKNTVDNNKDSSSSSKNTEASASSSSPDASADATEAPVDADDSPDELIETNADVSNNDDDGSKKEKGSNIWLILFLISLIANLLLIGFLLWRKFRKKAENILVEDDTPIVDYDIDEDFDDDII